MNICPQCKTVYEEGNVYCKTDGVRLTSVSKLQAAGAEVPAEAIAAAAREHELLAENSPGESLVGKTIAGRYTILKLLGEGGMGVVYSAVDTRLEKNVAIKILKEDFAHRQDVVARFTLEAKSAARIKHENVLDVTDYGQTEDGSFYIAMELLVGTDVADVLTKHGALDMGRALSIMIQVTRALSAAHGKGIVHRDLKPENIFLVTADDGREVVKIVDFGIAQMKDASDAGGNNGRKLTRTGMIFGTPEYMSPEQAAGKAIDHRVDIYATGVILYELLAGRVPFVGDTFMGVLTQHMFEAAPAIQSLNPQADVTPELEAVLNRALAKDANFRYASMQELTDDLVRLRDGGRPTATSAVIPAPPSRPNLTGSYAVVPSGLYQVPTGVHSSVPSPTMPDAGTGTGPASQPPKSKTATYALLGLGALVAIGAGIAVASALSGPTTPVVATATVTARVPSVAPTASTSASVTAAPTASVIASATAAPTASASGAPSASANPSAVASANPSAASAAPTASASSGASVPPGTENVRVRLTTIPAGARVESPLLPGLSCAATPCEVELPRGQVVRLIATARGKRGEVSVTPETGGQEVLVPLAATGGGGGGGNRPPNGGGGGAHAQPRCRPGQLQWFDRRDMIYRPCN